MSAPSKKPNWELIVKLHSIQWNRQWALDLLKEKHRLDLFSVQSDAQFPEKVRERQSRYESDLQKLKEKWAEEDLEIQKELAQCEES